MFKKTLKIGVAAVAAAAFVGSAQAALVIYEPFSQSTGLLNGKAGGTGLGNWTSTTGASGNVIAAPTLSYGILPNAGNQVNIPAGQASGDARATTTTALATAGLLNNGATLWFSVVTTGALGSNQHSGFAFGDAPLVPSFDGARLSGNAVGFYTRQGNVQAAVWSSTSAGLLPDALSGTLATPQTSTNLVVGKIEWGATAGDVEKITIFRPSLATLSLPATSVSTTIAGLNQASFNIVSFASRQGVQSFDEIRFGSSFNDVIGVTAAAVPEPATASLGLLALGGLMLRRRRMV